MRLKGLAACDRGEAHGTGGWVTQTAARSCPLLVKESIVVNDRVGLAVAADGRSVNEMRYVRANSRSHAGAHAVADGSRP